MPLFTPVDHDRRDHLLRRLQGLGDRVPEGALRFHRRRRDLQRALEGSRPRLLGLLPPRGMIRWTQAVEQLEELAPPLIDLQEQAETIEDEVRRILERCHQAVDDEELSRRLTTIADGWRNRLTQAVLDIDRPAELTLQRQRLRTLREEVQGHAPALDLLRRAEDVVRRLDRDSEHRLKAAPLKADLPMLRRDLIEGGAETGWLESLKERITLLEALPGSESIPLDLEDLYQELPEWKVVVHHRQVEVEAFVRDVDRARNDPRTDSSLTTMLVEAGRELLEDLRRVARELRERETRSLDGQLDDLERACGPQNDLRAQLRRLTHAVGGEAEKHEAWLLDLQDLQGQLQAAAWARHEELRVRLGRQLDGVHRDLQNLLERPLSPALREAVAASEAEGRRLRTAENPLDVLVQLRKAEELGLRSRQLQGRAEDEHAELQHRREALARRYAELQRYSAEIPMKIPDLRSRVEALERGSGDRNLEEVQRRATELESEMDQLAERFLEADRRAALDDLQVARRLEELLRPHSASEGIPPIPSDPPSWGPRTSPLEATVMRSDAAAARQALEIALAAAIEDLEARRDRAARRLTALPCADLPAIERQELVHVRLLLETKGEGDAEAQFLPLAVAVREAESFLDRRAEPARRIERQRTELRRRLRHFGQELGRPGLWDLANRITALVAGVPDPAEDPDVAAAAGQLEEADRLLTLLERQARRLAAADLDRHRHILEHRAKGTDAETAPEALRLLSELGPPTASTLPGAQVRNRIARLARRLAAPSPGGPHEPH